MDTDGASEGLKNMISHVRLPKLYYLFLLPEQVVVEEGYVFPDIKWPWIHERDA
jgi:hypothetical protein